MFDVCDRVYVGRCSDSVDTKSVNLGNCQFYICAIVRPRPPQNLRWIFSLEND